MRMRIPKSIATSTLLASGTMMTALAQPVETVPHNFSASMPTRGSASGHRGGDGMIALWERRFWNVKIVRRVEPSPTRLSGQVQAITILPPAWNSVGQLSGNIVKRECFKGGDECQSNETGCRGDRGSQAGD